MRAIRIAEEVPEGAVRVVGVLAGEPLEPVGVGNDQLDALGFKGEAAKTLAIANTSGPVVLVGLGDEVDAAGLTRAAGAAARAVPAGSVIATSLHTVGLDGALEAVVAGLAGGAYRFVEYRSGEQSPEGDIVLVGSAGEADLDAAVDLAEAVSQVRDWVNRPPADTSPDTLAAEMGTLLTDAGFDVEIWDEGRIADESLGGLGAVAAGSNRPPRLLLGRYRPEGAQAHLALVGKGIVFDSGGLSIKPAEAMETMKCDMAGAAAVVAGAAAVARSGRTVSITVIAPLTDNMSGGSATKPGDVLTARNGKTMEVLNTDAEGRLVLADALCLAVEEEPDLIVDMATLTGAARIALGDHIAPLFCSSDEVAESLETAASAGGERVWRLPLPDDYRRLIDSPVADMKNTGGRSASSILAALFLKEFVGDVPWAHVDIAAPAFLLEEGPHGPKGGTGFGVRTIAALASQLESSSTSSI